MVPLATSVARLTLLVATFDPGVVVLEMFVTTFDPLVVMPVNVVVADGSVGSRGSDGSK